MKRESWILSGIGVISLLLRYLYLAQLKATGLFGFYAADAQHFDLLALRILQGDLFFKDFLLVYPAYPFFLSGIYYIFGHHNFVAVAISQILLDTLSCILLYCLCLKIFNNKAIGLIASYLYACYGLILLYTGFLVGVTLSLFINILMILTFLTAVDKNKMSFWILSGIAMGTSFLITASNILFLPFCAGWVLCYGKEGLRRKAAYLLGFFVGMAIALAPFSLRNYNIQKTISPLPALGGMTFYQGYNPCATGAYASIPGISDMPVFMVKETILLAEKETGKHLTPQESSAYWFKKGLSYVRGNPLLALRLAVRKFIFFWNATEIPLNLNFYFCKNFLPVLKLPLFSFGCIAPFAIMGILFAIKEKLKKAYLLIAVVLVYMLSSMIFFVTDRYRLPAVPFIILLAAFAVTHLFDLLRHAGKKSKAFNLILLAAAIVFVNQRLAVSNTRTNFAIPHCNLGMAYHRKGMLDEAIVEYRKAIALKPDYAPMHYELGSAYSAKGMIEEAKAEYQKARELNPGLEEGHEKR